MRIRNKGKRKILRKVLLIILLIGLLAAFWFLPNLMTRRAGDIYSVYIFPVIAAPANAINTIFNVWFNTFKTN